jgi:hypothetical protein
MMKTKIQVMGGGTVHNAAAGCDIHYYESETGTEYRYDITVTTNGALWLRVKDGDATVLNEQVFTP